MTLSAGTRLGPPDGRLLLNGVSAETARMPFTVVMNWPALLRK